MDIILEGHRYSLPKDTICITNHNVKQVEERLSEFTAVHLCVKSEFIEDLPILQSKQSNAGTELIDFFKLNNNSNQQIDYLIFYPVQDEIKLTISEISKTMFTEMMKKETKKSLTKNRRGIFRDR